MTVKVPMALRSDMKKNRSLYSSDVTKIIKQYQGIIVKIAKIASLKTGEELEDLIQKGNLVLLEALNRFKFKKAKFITYLYYLLVTSLHEKDVDPAQSDISLDDPALEGEVLHKTIASNSDTDSQAILNEIWSFINAFPERQRDIILMRYQEDKTLQEIGNKIGISRERVRQIEAETLSFLRKSITRR